MAGYHSAVAIHPGTGYGVVVLLGGHYPDAAKLAYDTFARVQPGVDAALADMASELYAGEWVPVDAEDGAGAGEKPSGARIVVERGTLYIETRELRGVDVLRKFGAPGRLALRSSMRRDELRCASRPLLFPVHRHAITDAGCAQDRHGHPGVQRHGAHGVLPVLERAGPLGRA